MQTGNDHGINSAVQGSQICHCEGASRPWQSREGSHDFADSLPGIRLSSARLPRRFAPRNDKSEAFAILTVACTDCKCVAGPGCPLPYNGGCDQRDCLPEIAPQGHFLALRAQGATSAVGLLAMAKQEAFRILPYSFFSLQDSFISVPRPYSELPGKAQKSSDLSIGASCWRYLSSRAVTRKVLSAQMSLTSVFGMGTGVPSPQSTPTIWGHTLKTEQE